jgi:hypothetical protein
MHLTSRNVMTGFAIKLLSLAMILSTASTLKAQSFYGSILGTVADATGAVVPDAKVTVTNTGTSEARTVNSDAAGRFSIVNLVPATYKVEVTKTGFKRYLSDQVTVQVGEVSRVEAALEVGVVSQTVEVSTQSSGLKTDSSTLSTEISGSQVQEMPLNGRNVLNLIALTPGVVPTGGAMGDTGLNQGTRTAGGAGWGNYEIGGSIQGQSAQFIDGVANNLLGGNIVALVPTQDAIQEFSVASNNATADFGRYAGGVVNMTTRSGTNEFHGSAWEYLRNAVFNANDFFSNENGLARAKFNQNQYGVKVTGPIKRDKAFFMFTWEGFKALTGNLTPTNVPTTAMQNGIIPEVYNSTGALQNSVVDPLGNCIITHQPGTAAAPGTWTITNLNVGNCGDPTNKLLKTYYPAPNASGASNWVLTTPLQNNQNQYNGRIDYNISNKQRLFGRYTYWGLADTGHSEFLEANGWPTNDGHVVTNTQQVVLGDTYTFNPTTVLDVHVNYVRQWAPNLAASSSVDPAQFGPAYAALKPQIQLQTAPGFNASGVHGLYNLANFPNQFISWYNTYGISANLTKILGPHSLKFGTELRLMDQSSVNYGPDGGGSYTYTTSFTGDEWASFLMGYPTTVVFKTAAETAAYMYYQGYYVTDTWEASRNLTLTLGLRWELPGAIAERNNKATVLLPNAVDPTTGITGTEALVVSSLYGRRTTVVPEYNLFAPRVGFAYRVGADTVVRGGYGLSYLPNDLTTTTPFSSYVNGAATTVTVPTTGNPCQLQTILNRLATSGAPCATNNQSIAAGIVYPFGRSNPTFMTNLGSKTTYLGQNISGAVPFQPFPYVQQWNASLSHQFAGNINAEVAYAASKGTNLPGTGNRGLDELSSQYYGLGTGLAVKQPCAAANNLVLSVGQCDRPFPYYNNVQDTAEFYARSNYHSFIAKAEKRMGAAGVLMTNYTYSKNMANTDTQTSYLESKATTQGGNGDGTIQDWNNLGGEYSLISYDVTNRFIFAYVVNLPFGQGQKFGNSLSGPLNSLASGWAVNGITTFQSGFPVFLYDSGAYQLSSFGAGTARPNQVPGCNKVIGGSGLARVNAGGWFNTSCFTQTTAYAFGNEPRVDPSIRSDGIKNFDFAIQKSTRFYESANLEFRTEFFNIFNRVQFAPPIPSVGASNFGAVTYQVNKPRQIQLSLRLNF